jgi:hypothetical protein
MQCVTLKLWLLMLEFADEIQNVFLINRVIRSYVQYTNISGAVD